jgi:hypothetical protein
MLAYFRECLRECLLLLHLATKIQNQVGDGMLADTQNAGIAQLAKNGGRRKERAVLATTWDQNETTLTTSR